LVVAEEVIKEDNDQAKVQN